MCCGCTDFLTAVAWSGACMTLPMVCQLQGSGGGGIVTVATGGSGKGKALRLRATAALRRMLEAVAASDPAAGFCVGELPGDDPFEKVCLAEVLRAHQALLAVADGPACARDAPREELLAAS